VGRSEHHAGILFVGSTHAAKFIQRFGKQIEQLFQPLNVFDDASYQRANCWGRTGDQRTEWFPRYRPGQIRLRLREFAAGILCFVALGKDTTKPA
jgi:hypothetical protein